MNVLTTFGEAGITNTVAINDDGTNGPDQNPSDNVDTVNVTSRVETIPLWSPLQLWLMVLLLGSAGAWVRYRSATIIQRR